jgi:hypothetical protein
MKSVCLLACLIKFFVPTTVLRLFCGLFPKPLFLVDIVLKGFDIIVFTTRRAEGPWFVGPWFVGAGRRLRVSKKHEGRNLTFVPRKVGEALPTSSYYYTVFDSSESDSEVQCLTGQ